MPDVAAQPSSPAAISSLSTPITGPVKQRIAVLNKRDSDSVLGSSAKDKEKDKDKGKSPQNPSPPDAKRTQRAASTTSPPPKSRSPTRSPELSSVALSSGPTTAAAAAAAPKPIKLAMASIVHTTLLMQDDAGGPGLQGTPTELLDYTMEVDADDKWQRDLLCTYRSFATPRELLLRLVTRYRTAPPVERYVANQIREVAAWKQRLGPLQGRCVTVSLHFIIHSPYIHTFIISPFHFGFLF